MISDIGSYEISDFIPFSLEALISVFEQYNQSLWPFQILITLLLLLCLLLKLHHSKFFLIPLGLSCFFIGSFFHMTHLQAILWAGKWLGWLFVIQGLILISFLAFNPLAKKYSNISVFRQFGEVLIWASLLFPLSYITPITKGEILLLGWGPTATTIGTIGYLVHSFKTRFLILGILIPVIWIILFAILISNF